MSAALPKIPPRVTRPRPTDATGWFWAFVSLTVGLFFAAIFPPFAIVLVAFPFCFLWQFKKWHADSSIVKAATNWCERHYPNAGDTPIVDFMIAVAHTTNVDLSKCSPDTPIDQLNWMADDDQAEYWYPDAQDCTQAWLYDVFADAKINAIDLSAFAGSTLSDAADVLLDAYKTG
tara:strand:+ start:279 stop:803 length:525 start_codon:yes stop_codon:yes gene_type:complete